MVYALFQEQRQAHTDKLAIVWKDQHYSYQSLGNAVDQLIKDLHAAGIQAHDQIALFVPNSPEFVIGTLATWAIGASLLPLNTTYTEEELLSYTSNAKVKLVLVTEKEDQKIKDLGLTTLVIDAMPESIAESPTTANVPADSSALVMFSSGSTGTPKQVVRTYGAVIAEILNARKTLSLNSDDIIMCCAPMFHAHGLGNCLLAALMNGGTLVIHSGEFNPRKVVKTIAEFGVTIFPSVPFMCKMIASTPFKETPNLERLRLVYTAGAPLDDDTAIAFYERFGIYIGQLYGSTETGAATINAYPNANNRTSVGKPLANTVIKLIDDDGHPVPTGAEGEIIIQTAAMTNSYTGLAELTAETFKSDGYHTGDLGIMDTDGYLRISGRKKLMINVAGNKVDPLDIEKIVKQLPGVIDAVALGKPDPLYGEVVKVAIVSSGNLTAEDVRAHCTQHLVEYKVPKIIDFISEIPKSPLGKVLRKYL
jgi:long-chain acyl-CoA synthetase